MDNNNTDNNNKCSFRTYIKDACLHASFALGLIVSAFLVIVAGTFYGNKVYNNLYGDYRTPTSCDQLTVTLTDMAYTLETLLRK